MVACNVARYHARSNLAVSRRNLGILPLFSGTSVAPLSAEDYMVMSVAWSVWADASLIDRDVSGGHRANEPTKGIGIASRHHRPGILEYPQTLERFQKRHQVGDFLGREREAPRVLRLPEYVLERAGPPIVQKRIA